MKLATVRTLEWEINEKLRVYNFVVRSCLILKAVCKQNAISFKSVETIQTIAHIPFGILWTEPRKLTHGNTFHLFLVSNRMHRYEA